VEVLKVVREMGDSGEKVHGFLRRLPGSDESSLLLRRGGMEVGK
jgi:hypothetical protein